MSKEQFKKKLIKLEDEGIKQKLMELYNIDPEEAIKQAFIERSHIISRNNKKLYDELSKL